MRDASVGIAVHSDELAVVVVRAARVQAIVRQSRSAGTLAEDVASVMALVPRRRWLRYRITIAAGAEQCRLKQLEGLPNTADLRTLSQIVRENAACFFLQRGGLSVSSVVRDANGRLWAAAFEHSVLTEIADLLRANEFARVRAVPSVAAIARVATSVPGIESAVAVAAYGAAVMPNRASHVWEPERPARTATRWTRLRLAATMTLALAAALAAMLAPGIRAEWFVVRARVDAIRLRAVSEESARDNAELSRARSLIQRADAFRARRGRLTLLLGALTQALPESTAIVALRVDSTAGSFTALSPHAADVVPQLASVDGLTGARIAGAITRETIAGAQLERATFRFERRHVSGRR